MIYLNTSFNIMRCMYPRNYVFFIVFLQNIFQMLQNHRIPANFILTWYMLLRTLREHLTGLISLATSFVNSAWFFCSPQVPIFDRNLPGGSYFARTLSQNWDKYLSSMHGYNREIILSLRALKCWVKLLVSYDRIHKADIMFGICYGM